MTTPERFQQIQELFHAALKLPPAERQAFLNATCLEDESLRQEVESLLAEDADVPGFLQTGFDASRSEPVEILEIPAGRAISHYQVLEKIGEGGMGAVYKARDQQLGRLVALKILSSTAAGDPERKRRFIQEAKAASALNHPNIITIYEIAQEDGLDFIAMEYVKGRTLDQFMARKRLPMAEAVRLAIQMADALAAAHAAGIVHRDLKPGNIMVTGEGLVKILDFGIAKLTESKANESEEVSTIVHDGPRTEEGKLLGTAAYMSPEQVECKKLDGRSDIFAFGAVLYELVTGRRAFQRESRIATLSAVVREQPAPIHEILQDVPVELGRIINRCLRKEPERRFQDMDDLKIALLELKEDSTRTPAPPTPRSYRRWVGGLVLLLMLGSGLWIVVVRRALEKPVPTPQRRESRRRSLSGYTLMREGAVQDLRNAIEYFNLAIAADPRNASARADLSLACSKLLETETAPFGELILVAKSQAQEAVRLDRSIAEAHHALAQALILSDYAWDAAATEFRRALAIDPAYTDARYAYVHICLVPRGLYEEAVRQLNEGLKRDPLSGTLNTELASTDIKCGRIDSAIDRLRQSLARYPSAPGSLTHIATALLAKSQDHDALTNLLYARRSAPGDPWIASYLALCYLRLGEPASAQAILRELLTLTPPPDSSIAAVYAALGNKDAAFEHLERAYSAHSMKLLWLGVDRRFEPLRADPRFKELLARMHLPH